MRRRYDIPLAILIWLSGATFVLSERSTAGAIMWVATLAILRGKL